jgi:hypothetical protein
MTMHVTTDKVAPLFSTRPTLAIFAARWEPFSPRHGPVRGETGSIGVGPCSRSSVPA